MRGINLSEGAHIVNVLPAVDITGGKVGDIFSMAKWSHATIIMTVGVSAAAWTKILLEECSDFAGTNNVAIPFRMYKEETALGDTLTSYEMVAAAGYTPNAADNIMYIIELDHSELSEGKQFVKWSVTNGANSVIAACVAILTGARYANDQSATAII